ncbi:hypothetical protein [Arthrobacter sp. Br18]|uniref:hypothetical protein n=1 Tax=Arthrobacter sp. Br18 TaxID=1312954 RepID=UPI0004ADB519|nr:hypothetical protein [Arthrobacter sp. Br18]
MQLLHEHTITSHLLGSSPRRVAAGVLLLLLLPLIVGCGWGVVLVRRYTRSVRPGRSRRHLVRLGVLAIASAGVVVLAAGLVRPASTRQSSELTVGR